MSIEIKRSDKYVDYNISATNNRGYITIDTSDWINKPWMFYELPALKFEIYTETNGELVKYQNFSREIRTYNPVYSPLGVLNVTIDIRNVPEEFILRITPIFDNDAIAARNMLIENGIENGDIWGSDQDVPTQLFNLDLEFIECTGEYIPPIPPTHEETVTFTEPPYTFDHSDGSPIISLTIKGNGQQIGTPTPDNPIQPEFVGVKTANLFDKNSNIVAYYLTQATGVYTATSSISRSILIPCEPSTTYTIMIPESRTFRIASFSQYPQAGDSGDKYELQETDTYEKKEYIYTTSSNAMYMCVFCYNVSYEGTQYTESEYFDGIMINLGSTALPYEPFGWAEKITCAGQTTTVYLGQVSAVRKIKKRELKGTEVWQPYNGNYYSSAIDSNSQQAQRCICTHLSSTSTSGIYVDRGSSRLKVFSASVSDVAQSLAEWKTFLADEYAAGHPVTIWYVLATEQTGITNEPLAKIGNYADELSSTDAAVTIPTVKGQNTLTVDTDLQPSEMTITYIKEGQ